MEKNIYLKDYLYSSMFAALISILALLSIPLPNGPSITGQTLGVMLAGSMLKPKQAALSIMTYLALGSIGLPVFSGGQSGFGVFAGKSGGYLIGFLAGAVVISLIKASSNNLFMIATSNLIGGIIVVHVIGSFWLGQISGLSFYQAFMLGSLPYLPGDIIKLICATLVAHSVNKQLPLSINHK
ncbi:biotin transporter BioY [Acetivibrio cellulolyticus]|uniref:biotin transporter BioY n=1 Tax=Acetivibrio cellulolyticus TaxID=35830 RepID=UPI0001E2E7BA|nr:biotin transporter BioY [Acetivibrio cellulolyticus]